jgi:hypothetical protein
VSQGRIEGTLGHEEKFSENGWKTAVVLRFELLGSHLQRQ